MGGYKNRKGKKLFGTLTAINGEVVMVFQALIAGESADARLAVALTRLDVASRGRQRAHQVALAVPAAGLDVSITILEDEIRI